MNKLRSSSAVVVLLGSFLTGSSYAEERAVSEINVALNASFGAYDFNGGNSDQTIASGGATITIPLGRYIGYFGSYSAGRAEFSDVDAHYWTYLSSNGLFVRKSDLGAIALTARRATVDFSGVRHRDDYYEPLIAFYGPNYTLAATTLVNAATNDSWSVAATWYPTSNFLLSAGVGVTEQEESYAVRAEKQIGEGGFSIGGTIGRNPDASYNFVSITAHYRFAKPKTLLARYRNDIISQY